MNILNFLKDFHYSFSELNHIIFEIFAYRFRDRQALKNRFALLIFSYQLLLIEFSSIKKGLNHLYLDITGH
jgi:hypothetical protein